MPALPRSWRFLLLVLLCASLPLIPSTAFPQAQQQKFQPKLEAVAETKLLMEGIINSNFRGLDKFLRKQPANVQTWKYIRGQALLVAETGNLLMLRPPKTEPARTVWFKQATSLRNAATELARAASKKDFTTSRINFVKLANTCNSCHQSFSVKVQVTPFKKS